MEEDLRSFGSIRAEEGDSPVVNAVISTGNVARDNAIIDPKGWDFRNFDANPVVLWGHDGSELPIGRAQNRKLEGGELRAQAVLDKDDEFAMRVFGKIQRGFVNATSVRWHPTKWEHVKRKDLRHDDEEDEHDEEKVLVFRKQELLEFSFVSIPADPAALIVRADNGEPFSPPDEGPSNRAPDDPVAAFLDHIDAIVSVVAGATVGVGSHRLNGPAIGAVQAAHTALASLLPAQAAPEPDREVELDPALAEAILSLQTTQARIELALLESRFVRGVAQTSGRTEAQVKELLDQVEA